MWTVYLFLLVGIVILFLSGKYLVDSSVVLSRHLRIPRAIIGLTVVAFGTSAPELLVSVQAAMAGFPEIAMGNVVGSNLSNILLVLALTALIFPISVSRSSVRTDWPMMMGVSLLLFLFVLNGNLARWEGLVLMAILAAYIVFSVKQARAGMRLQKAEDEPPSMRVGVAILIFLVSCAGLAFGADLLVDNAAVIAEELGISRRVISVSMVAVGTSIPEVATSVIAAFKKETDISVGNIIGSNIMNILSVLGITAVIAPVGVDRAIALFDIPWMLGASLLLLFLMLPAARSRIDRWEGVLMILVYLLYLYLIF